MNKQLNFNKDTGFFGGKQSFLTNNAGKALQLSERKETLVGTSQQTQNSKWIIDINIKAKTLNLPGESLCNLKIGKIFLISRSKSKSTHLNFYPRDESIFPEKEILV